MRQQIEDHDGLTREQLRAYGMKGVTFLRVTFIALSLFLLCSTLAQAQTLTYTVKTTTSDGRTVVPEFTWATTPAAAGCTASGATGWTGAREPQGTLVLPSIAVTKSFRLECFWTGDNTALLKFTAPTELEGGAPLTDLGGFRVQYGRNLQTLDESVYLQDPALREWRSPPLAAGEWCFGMRSFRTNGLESEPIKLASPSCKTMTVGATQSRTLVVSVELPAPPSTVTLE
jgi:hypothetical protein